jgi:hypothetical protein
MIDPPSAGAAVVAVIVDTLLRGQVNNTASAIVERLMGDPAKAVLRVSMAKALDRFAGGERIALTGPLIANWTLAETLGVGVNSALRTSHFQLLGTAVA